MKSLFHSFIFSAAIFGTYICPTVHAAIILGTADGFGVDSLTIDTSTGLEWLDWTESVSNSFDEINAEFGVGGDFEGFRHATVDELGQFLVNLDIGLPLDNYLGSETLADGRASAIAFTDLVGNTAFPGPDRVEATAVTADTVPVLRRRVVRVVGSGIVSVVVASSALPDSSRPDVGHALVRETVSVPEPDLLSCWLGFGIVGLTKRRRIVKRFSQPGSSPTNHRRR